MRSLITGANGFLGSYLVEELKANGHEVIATSLKPIPTLFKVACEKLDFCNFGEVKNTIEKYRPDCIFHLGAISFVPDADKDFLKTLEVNVAPVNSILKICADLKLDTKFVFMSSAEVYGHTAKKEVLTENSDTQPGNSYSLSKLMAENVILKYFNSGELKDFAILRPFNSVGFGQNSSFALASFAEQIHKSKVLKVGNLEVSRDFTNVKDTVRGIRLAAEKGHGIYNLCFGKTYALSDLVNRMIAISGHDIKVEVDLERFRPAEVLDLRGSADKAKAELGWVPEIQIEQTLKEILGL